MLGPINPPKNVKTCQNGEKRSTTLAMVHGWASPVHRATVGDRLASSDPLGSTPATRGRYCHVYTWRTAKRLPERLPTPQRDGVGDDARAQIELQMSAIERGPRLCRYDE